jgi:hypothetical protein
MASRGPKISKQGTAGKRKHETLTMLLKLHINRSLESATS